MFLFICAVCVITDGSERSIQIAHTQNVHCEQKSIEYLYAACISVSLCLCQLEVTSHTVCHSFPAQEAFDDSVLVGSRKKLYLSPPKH